LGLIGSSMLKKLSMLGDYQIFCYSKSSFKKAQEYTKNSSDNIEIVKDCHIVFVCSKLSETLSYLDKLNNILDKSTIVVDVASVKEENYPKYNFDFILSHPMAGTEKSGFSAGYPELFKGSKWLIEKENDILNKIIFDLEAIPLKINMSKHNFLTAQISHLPTVLSFLLFDCTCDDSKMIAASGFRDTTRLAMTNYDLVESMFKNNNHNVLKAFDLLVEKMNFLKNLNEDERIKLFQDIAIKRVEMYDSDGKNVFKM